MAEYVFIQNYANIGKLAISHNVFNEIVNIVTNRIQGVSISKDKRSKKLFSFHRPIHCEIKNGTVTSFIEIKVAAGQDVEAIKKTIQDEVISTISIMTEMVPFSPVVKVVGTDEKL